jgi:hypothetical protein
LSSFTRLFYFFAGSSFLASTLQVLSFAGSHLAGAAGVVVAGVAAGVAAGFATSVAAKAETAKEILTRIALINLVIK